MEDRKMFKFFKSYYDVAQQLPEKDRLLFYDALMKKQFTGEETILFGMANFAYISQRHNIESQVVGYCKRMDIDVPLQGGASGGASGGAPQEKEKEKEKEQYISPKGEMIDFDILLETLNKIFGKEFRVVNKTVREKYKALLKQGYTKANIHTAMLNCKNDEFHKKNNWKYCNIAYFARPNTIDLHGTQIIPEQKGIVGTYTIHDHD